VWKGHAAKRHSGSVKGHFARRRKTRSFPICQTAQTESSFFICSWNCWRFCSNWVTRSVNSLVSVFPVRFSLASNCSRSFSKSRRILCSPGWCSLQSWPRSLAASRPVRPRPSFRASTARFGGLDGVAAFRQSTRPSLFHLGPPAGCLSARSRS